MESILNLRQQTIEKLKQYHLDSVMFYLAFITYVVGHFLSGTMYIYVFNDKFLYNVWLIACFLALVKICLFNTYRSWKDTGLVVGIGLIIWVSCLNTNSWDMIYYYVMIIAAQDMKFENIVKVSLVTLVIMLVFTFISAKLGIIVGMTNMRDGSTDLRYALGTVYPTDLAARLFYIELFYVVLRKFKLTLPEYVIWMTVIAFGYIVTNTRLDAILMVMILLTVLLKKQVISFLKKLKITGISVISATMILLIIGVTYLYKPHNFLLDKIDHLLSGRLRVGHIAFERFNVSFFGQVVPQNGNGGLHKYAYEYFYIDCSYIRVLMMNGLVVFLILMLALFWMIRYFWNVKAYTLLLALLFVLVSSVIDQHLLEISYDCIFLTLFSNITYLKNRWE